jgi:diadenosine tetraphosphate (Ap4A) HIT family hydrolase
VGRHSSAGDDLIDGWRHDRVGSARRGENPMVLARMRSGWAILGDTQFLPGYCLLLSDIDGVNHLTDLDRAARAEFLDDMGLLGEAIVAACNGLDPSFRRINYEILGNADRGLRVHLFPRYGWEPEELAGGAVWRYPHDRWTDPRDAFSEEHQPLREAITTHLTHLLPTAHLP